MTRLFFGSLMIAALGGIVFADGYLSARNPLWSGLLITLLVLVLVIFASYELGRLLEGGGRSSSDPSVKSEGYRPVTHWVAIASAGLVVIPWIELQQRLGTICVGTGACPIENLMNKGLAGAGGPGLTTVWLVGAFLITCLAVLSRKTTIEAVGSMAATVFMILYLGLLGAFAVRVRCLWPGAAGAAIMVYFLLTVKSSDIGAYFVGSAIGRHKLAPWVSPGKTIEGAIGAIVVAAGVAAGGMVLWDSFRAVIGPSPLGITQAIIFGSLMAIVGHVGDLVESAIKRDMGHKDSAKVVPAFGGLLDIVDSPLFTAPVAWWLLTMWVNG